MIYAIDCLIVVLLASQNRINFKTNNTMKHKLLIPQPYSIFKYLVFCILLSHTSIGWSQLPLVYSEENTGVACDQPPLPAPDELTNHPLLPNPFAWSDGSGEVTQFSDWECRRNEIAAEIAEYEIGTKPAPPENITASLSGSTLTVSVTVNNQTLTLTSNVNIPDGEGPFPVVIGMNNPTGSLPAELFEGVIQVPFMHNQVVTYTQTSSRNPDDPYYDLYPDLYDAGNYSAWSWGVSRLIDGIEMVREDLHADLSHLAVTGCSYAGKMALFSGAYDERVALTIVQEAGGGGINAWRVSETIGNVEKIDNTNYSWFMESMRTNFAGKVGLLPHDHHELMAMVVPRAMLVLGNPPYEWLGDESGYVSSRAAQEVYKRFGIEDRFGFSFRSGHNHCQLPNESYPEVEAFVDKFLFGDESANTNIQVHEFENTDYNSWIEAWKEPADPNAPSVSLIGSTESKVEAPGSVTLEATVTDPNDDIEKVLFYDGQELLGEDMEPPYTLTLTDLLAGNYYFSAEAIDAQDLKGYSNVVNLNVLNPTILIMKTESVPLIDSEVDDMWNESSVIAMEAATVLVGSDLTQADISGSVKLLWDETNIYFLASITDDTRINDSQNTYEDDNVELYFDINNAKSGSYQTDDVQYSFRWDDGTNVGALPADRSTAGIEYAIAATADGYMEEGLIPWATLGGTPAKDMEMGFDFMVNDDDNGTGRDAKLSWNAYEDQAWQNTELFGTIKLMSEEAEEEQEGEKEILELKKKTETLIVCPNPVANQLNILGVEGRYNYQIADVSGKIILQGKSRPNIEVSHLKSGVYFLRVIQKGNSQTIKFVK